MIPFEIEPTYNPYILPTPLLLPTNELSNNIATVVPQLFTGSQAPQPANQRNPHCTVQPSSASSSFFPHQPHNHVQQAQSPASAADTNDDDGILPSYIPLQID
jgi:hypothetical protein